MVTDWRHHCDEAFISICQRKNTKPVKYVLRASNHGKLPSEVVLVNLLREQGDDPKMTTDVGAEFSKRHRQGRQHDGGCGARAVLYLKRACATLAPFIGQPISVPSVVMSDCDGKSDQ